VQLTEEDEERRKRVIQETKEKYEGCGFTLATAGRGSNLEKIKEEYEKEKMKDCTDDIFFYYFLLFLLETFCI
jgi:hypothetical protein